MGRGGLQQAVASNQIYSRPTGEPTVTAASSTSEPLSQSTPQETSTNAQVAGRRLLYTQQQPLTQSLLTALLAPNLQTIYPPVERRLMTLTNLANLIHYLDNTSTGLENAIPPGFLDPVRIPPTEDQIDAATVVEVPQDQETATCSVCQDSFEAEQEARKILHCGHLFHLECIDTWFEQASTCPTCRYDIREYQANNPPPAEIPPQSDLDGVE